MNYTPTIAVLCLLAILTSTVRAQSPEIAPATTQAVAVPGGTTAGPAASTPTADDGFAPGLLVMVLAFLFLCAVVIVLAAIIGAAALLLGAVLLLFGIISSSVLIGLCRRTGGSAVRAFLVQACAIAGVPMGVLALWLENRLFHVGLTHEAIVFAGVAGRLATGAGAGYLISLVTERLGRFVLGRLPRYPSSAPLGGLPAVVPDAVEKARRA